MPITLNGIANYGQYGTPIDIDSINSCAYATWIKICQYPAAAHSIFWFGDRMTGVGLPGGTGLFRFYADAATGAFKIDLGQNPDPNFRVVTWTSNAGQLELDKLTFILFATNGLGANDAAKFRIYLGKNGAIADITALGTWAPSPTLWLASPTVPDTDTLRFGVGTPGNVPATEEFLKGALYDQWVAPFLFPNLAAATAFYNAGVPPDLTGLVDHWWLWTNPGPTDLLDHGFSGTPEAMVWNGPGPTFADGGCGGGPTVQLADADFTFEVDRRR